MAKERPEESYAARVVEAHLKRTVRLNDDNSRERMVDLVVRGDGLPTLAIEVVLIVDPVWRQTFAEGPQKGARLYNVPSNWKLAVANGTNVKALERELPTLLPLLYTMGCESLAINDLEWERPELYALLEPLGLVHIFRYDAPYEGKVWIHTDVFAVCVPQRGEGVSEWLTELLASERHEGDRRKLRCSNADRKELFLYATMSGAPRVWSYLCDHVEELPADQPILPDGIHGAWIIGPRQGIVYREGRWARLDLPPLPLEMAS